MKNVLTILLILTILISGCTTTGTNVYGRTTVATTNRTLGKLEENVAKLKEFLRDNPEWAFVHYALGIEYAKLGRYPEAMAKFEDALRINPRPESPIALSTDRNAILGYEKARQKLNQALEENIQKYKKIVSENPDNAEAHKNLGSSYYFLGRYQEAVAELEEALRINTEYATAHLALGLTYDGIKDGSKAIIHTLKAKKLYERKNDLEGKVESKKRLRCS